jgi:hypothetical protein
MSDQTKIEKMLTQVLTNQMAILALTQQDKMHDPTLKAEIFDKAFSLVSDTRLLLDDLGLLKE